MQYEPPTGTSELWHEDREIDGVMYRATNAKFDDQTNFTWDFVDSSEPAYCFTQNTDGSTSFLYMPVGSSPWATWQGAGQVSEYNAINYGLNVNDPSGGADNLTALQNALDAIMSSGLPGVLVIPPGSYKVTGQVSISAGGSDPGIIIAGSSGGTKLVQQGWGSSVGTTFSFTDCNSNKGIHIQDLIIMYSQAGSTELGGPAIYVTASSNVTCERVFFSDCPAVDFDNGSFQCGLFECMIEYLQGADGQTMVTLGGAENYIDNCNIQQAGGSPANCTGILVQPAGGGVYVTNCQIAKFAVGIKIVGASVNLLHGFFSNLHCESYTNAVLIQPANSTAQIYQAFFDDCVFALTNDSASVSAGVLIDLVTNGGSVSDIFFNNCMCHGWAGPGMQITGGQDIVIIGGRYGSNATDSTMTTSGGIAVTGAAVRVTIVGADCSGQVPGDGVQPYGISVTGAVVSMRVLGCNLTNNGNGALYAPTSGTDLRITDCNGYNDRVLQLTATAPPTLTRFNGATYGYFGPSTFYVSGSGISAIKVSNSGSASAPAITTGLLSGAFRLDPGEWGEIDHSGGVISFVLVGT